MIEIVSKNAKNSSAIDTLADKIASIEAVIHERFLRARIDLAIDRLRAIVGILVDEGDTVDREDLGADAQNLLDDLSEIIDGMEANS